MFDYEIINVRGIGFKVHVYRESSEYKAVATCDSCGIDAGTGYGKTSGEAKRIATAELGTHVGVCHKGGNSRSDTAPEAQ